MWINNKPITTTGISQQTTGIKIQGKKEAAYEPVIKNLSKWETQSLKTWEENGTSGFNRRESFGVALLRHVQLLVMLASPMF